MPSDRGDSPRGTDRDGALLPPLRRSLSGPDGELSSMRGSRASPGVSPHRGYVIFARAYVGRLMGPFVADRHGSPHPQSGDTMLRSTRLAILAGLTIVLATPAA